MDFKTRRVRIIEGVAVAKVRPVKGAAAPVVVAVATRTNILDGGSKVRLLVWVSPAPPDDALLFFFPHSFYNRGLANCDEYYAKAAFSFVWEDWTGLDWTGLGCLLLLFSLTHVVTTRYLFVVGRFRF